MIEILWQGLTNGLGGVWTLAVIVIPLMIVLEVAKSLKWLDKMSKIIHPPFRQIGLSEDGAFPVLVALIFGITYGGGVIIANIREGKLNPLEVRVIGTFMAICHALIEDTLIFVVIGIPFWILVFPRLIVAIIACLIVYRIHLWRQEKAVLTAN